MPGLRTLAPAGDYAHGQPNVEIRQTWSNEGVVPAGKSIEYDESVTTTHHHRFYVHVAVFKKAYAVVDKYVKRNQWGKSSRALHTAAPRG